MWTVLPSEFDLHYAHQKLIKGNVMLEFLVDSSMEDQKEETIDFFDKEVFQVKKDV